MPGTKKDNKSETGIDAVEYLESQHREAEELFDELSQTSSRAAKSRRTLVQKIATALEAHAQIEEKIFYPEGRDIDLDMTLEAYEEHKVMRYSIEQLKATSPDDESFLARVTVLQELVKHHVEEEEQEYFPKVSKKLGKKRVAELGLELSEAYQETLASLNEKEQVPDQSYSIAESHA